MNITRTVDQHTGFLIRRAQQAHVAAWQSVVSNVVTSVQFGVLSTLAEYPGASQRDLCEQLDLDRSTIADIVVRLERRQLIDRSRDVLDTRRNVLWLTEAGERELKRMRPRVEELDELLTGMLNAEEVTILRHLLQRVGEAPTLRNLTPLDNRDCQLTSEVAGGITTAP